MAIYRYINGKSSWTAEEDINIITSRGSINLHSNKKINLNGEEGINYGDYVWIEAEAADAEDKDSYPILILHGMRKKGRNRNDTGPALDMMYGDYIGDKGLIKLYNELYREELSTLKESTFIIGDKKQKAQKFAEDKIKKIKPFLEKTDKELFDIFRNKVEWYSIGKLEEVSLDIVNKMQKNKGGEFSHKYLNNETKNHKNFIRFAEGIEDVLFQQIESGKQIENLETTVDTPANKHSFYNAVVNSGVKSLNFGGFFDNIRGLRILTNDIWAYEVRVMRYTKNHNILSIDLQYNLYDHFGLDYPDIHKFDQDIFYVWFVLQHFKGYKPLITNIEVQRTYRMIVPSNW